MPISITPHQNVALLTFDDGRGNTFTAESLRALTDALPTLKAADAVVIAGRAGMFSGGLDLKKLPTLSRAERGEIVENFCRVMMLYWELPRPSVAAVTGHALGGGAIFALTSDLRLGVAGNHRFGLIEVAVGVPLPGFAVEIARSAVGGATLTELVLHGRTYTMDETLGAGISSGLFGGDAVVGAALERATALAKLPGQAYAATKFRLREEGFRRAWSCIGVEGLSLLDAFDAMMVARQGEFRK